MKIEITHITRYQYGDLVSDSINELRLTPRTDDRQACYQHEIEVEPPTSMFTYEDYFGNRVHSFSIDKPHNELVIKAKATVVTQDLEQEARIVAPGGAVMLSAEEADLQLKILRSPTYQDRHYEYIMFTEYTELTDEAREYATKYPIGSDGLYTWLKQLSLGIHADFIYDPAATSVHTTVNETIELRRGVCQDFAHLMIAICRLNFVPARYVSGYHFVGDLQGGSADFEQASHAWMEAHVPGLGWLGFDPTNKAEMGWRYVKLGHGRDYKDIVPVKGVYRGTGEQTLDIHVDVRKLTV